MCAVGEFHLCPVDLALPLGEQDAVGEVGDVLRRRPGVREDPHAIQTGALEFGVVVGMLNKQPSCGGSIVTDHAPSWPAVLIDDAAKPAGVVTVDVTKP